jgi:hypothetical protein
MPFMLKPGQPDKPPSTFWRRLYSVPSLLCLALIAVAVWSSLISSLYVPWPQAPPQAFADFDLVGPSPSPQLSCVELYQQRQDAEFIRRCRIEERIHIYSLERRGTPHIIAAAGHPTEEARLLSLQRYRNAIPAKDDSEPVAGAPPTATAICADGTYSYAASRRVACSHHGGVAQWLSR